MIRTPSVEVTLTWRELSALKHMIEAQGRYERSGFPRVVHYSGPMKRLLSSAHAKLDEVDHELLEQKSHELMTDYGRAVK